MRLTGLPSGTRVQHRGTKCWGTIVRSHPQRDGTYEYEVRRDQPWMGIPTSELTWWASYHLGDVELPPATSV